MVFYIIIAQEGLKKCHLEHLRSKFSLLSATRSNMFKTYQKILQTYIVPIIAYNIKTISLLHFFRYVFEVDFTFSNVIIAHVSILVAPLLLNNATKTNSFFNIFVFLHFHHHPSHDHHRHHQSYDHHHRSHHQLRNLMLIMISR